MGLSLKHLINTIIDNGAESTKNVVLCKLANGIKEEKDEKTVCKEIYSEVYGSTLIPELCEELIDTLHQGSEHGSKWTKADCESIANKLGYRIDSKPYSVHEFRAAMHICYYMMNVPLKESGINMDPTSWGRCANFYFTSDDAFKDKLVGLYFSKVH
jgi:hypothetical protein